MERKQSELTVITKAKDLCSYVIENLYRANDIFVTKVPFRDSYL